MPNLSGTLNNALHINILKRKRMHNYMFYKMFFIRNKCVNFARD